MFLENSQNSQVNTGVRDSFLHRTPLVTASVFCPWFSRFFLGHSYLFLMFEPRCYWFYYIFWYPAWYRITSKFQKMQWYYVKNLILQKSENNNIVMMFYSEVYLGSCQTSVIKLFFGNSWWFLAVIYFPPKRSLTERTLGTPLTSFSHIKMHMWTRSEKTKFIFKLEFEN